MPRMNLAIQLVVHFAKALITGLVVVLMLRANLEEYVVVQEVSVVAEVDQDLAFGVSQSKRSTSD